MANIPTMEPMQRRDAARRGSAPGGARAAGEAPATAAVAGTGARAKPPTSATFELAGPADGAALGRLLRDSPMAGRVRLAFTREPDYFAASAIGGSRQATLVLRGEEGRGLIAMGSRAVLDVWLDGRRERLGYLSELRWATGVRPGLRRLVRGYARIRSLRRDDELPFDLTSIVADNLPARRLLERGLPGMPTYTPFVELETLVLGARPGAGVPDLVVRDARPDHLGAFAERLEREGRLRRLAPRWTEARLAELASGRLGPWHAFVLLEGGTVAACAALWDLRALRQVVVHSYAPPLRRLRPWLNPLLRLAGRPALPPPGSTLPMGYASHLCAENPEQAAALLSAVLHRAGELGLHLVSLAFPAGDPALHALRRRFGGRALRSVLYLVHDHDAPPPRLEGRDVLCEVALL